MLLIIEFYIGRTLILVCFPYVACLFVIYLQIKLRKHVYSLFKKECYTVRLKRERFSDLMCG
jgi:hypothetical protein